ncbi:hypothetical protein [Streptomyces cadmiisoli]|uniref:hypothetical protein n=1 Tax=Streptomyces cadmiisoli TaxID=2184053 RepID=UPI003D75F863
MADFWDLALATGELSTRQAAGFPVALRWIMVAVDEHTDFHRFNRASWTHPLRVGAIEVVGCPVVGINWDSGDHAMRHRGERRFGQVYPVTLQCGPEGGTMMRWTIPSYVPSQERTG